MIGNAADGRDACADIYDSRGITPAWSGDVYAQTTAMAILAEAMSNICAGADDMCKPRTA